MAACTVCEIHAECVFKVEGMDCHEEVAILDRTLKKLSGLEAVDADVLAQRLRVKYDAARLSTSTIAEAVAQTGMRAWLEHDEPAGPPVSAATRRTYVVVSGVMLVAGLLLEWLRAPEVVSIGAFIVSIGSGSIYTARRAIAAARLLALDINVLMLVAVAGAVALKQWSEGASVIFLFALAQLLEARAMERARASIRALMDLTPVEALVRRGLRELRVNVDDLHLGDVVIVRPGEKIPLDGRVTSGRTYINQAPVTGESLPVEKGPGDEVFAGTINGRGAIEVAIERLRADSTVARIIHLVERAQGQRAPSQTFVERFARIYTPAVLVLAAVVAVVPPLAGAGAWSMWIYRSLVLLVISCPCALVISTPVSVVSALSAAARKGVLIKGGAHLERLAAVRCVAFDKTGTLTRGTLKVVDVQPVGDASPDELLRVAASIESRSEHPIGRAILERALLDAVRIDQVSAFEALPGLGAEAVIGDAPVVLGSHRLLEERGACSAAVHETLQAHPQDGRTTVLVAGGGRPLGIISVADEIRESAPDAIRLLRAQGIEHVALLTGDQPAAAEALARIVGVDQVRAGLLPEDKVREVTELRRRFGVLAMVGDGVNDAPALAAADVGIAMGVAGTDAALETADVALMSDELLRLPYAVRLSRAALRNIRANIGFSIALKAAFLVMAVFGAATLWMAVVADSGASLIVIANALRLLRE
ncbi:MAG TPA: heavy metal translocating P-type ATPase [Vicinamibacterales bacterium]|jgi:Cd2+/Zn2+-exporting ATPase|nr:heavy metal translocating P-type ATPase [Vicinamibacterales bacterium]